MLNTKDLKFKKFLPLNYNFYFVRKILVPKTTFYMVQEAVSR